MTAMNLYLAQARIEELHGDVGHRGRLGGGILAETLQVLRGALTPVSGTAAGLGPDLRNDLNLR